MEKQVVIFDFDGTLGDSFGLMLEGVNRYAGYFGYPTIEDPEEIERLRSMTPQAIVSDLHIQLWKIPFLGFLVKRYVARHRQRIQLFPGIHTLLQELDEQGKEVYVLSSNRKSTIHKLLVQQGCREYIRRIVGSSSLFGKHRDLKKLIRRTRKAYEEVVYVADEIRDRQACESIGLDMIAVTWGFNNAEVLKKYANYTADDIAVLKAYLLPTSENIS